MGNLQLNFLNNWIYPWLVLVGMVAAYLATSVVDAGGARTSFAIGIVGAASIVFRTVYGWWIFLRLGSQERLSRRETRAWTGLTATLARWLSIVVEIIGWLGLLILTTWSLSN